MGFAETRIGTVLGELPLVYLRLDVDPGRVRQCGQSGDFDLIVKVPNVGDDRLMLHAPHVVGGDHVSAAGRGDVDVGDVKHLFKSGHLEAVHCRLERADRVDLSDDHAGALSAQRFRTALAHVSVTADNGDLAADQHVSCAVETIDQRVSDAVTVVEL